MELQTKRLQIIPCTEATLAKNIVAKDYEVGPHIDMYLDELKQDPSLLGWGVWFVLEKESNTIIGDIGFKGKPNSYNTVEIGYGIAPSNCGNGYATEAVTALIQWAFSQKDVTKIVAECHNDNIPSINVLEKINMKKVGQKNNLLQWELKMGHQGQEHCPTLQ